MADQIAEPFTNERIYIGTAGWNIPAHVKGLFPGPGTHLQKYSRVFNAVEINSSFYKDHKPSSYVKWASSTPDHFRFSVKLSRYFTQETRLQTAGVRLQETLAGIMELKYKLEVLLVQLPPSLEFDLEVADKFLNELRELYAGTLVWEPRHRSWADETAIGLLEKYNISKVHADPEMVILDDRNQHRLQTDRYYRLHGSPKIYKSKYTDFALDNISQLVKQPRPQGRSAWVIFDNTTYGYATEDALELITKLSGVKSRLPLKNLPVQIDDIGFNP